MAQLGWTPPTKIDDALAKTVEFYRLNPQWL
jgi:hypothetical protein